MDIFVRMALAVCSSCTSRALRPKLLMSLGKAAVRAPVMTAMVAMKKRILMVFVGFF